MELHREQGLPVVIFRPGIVIGRGGSPLHWGIGMWSFDAVCQVWGEGRNPLPLVLVQDVASALVAALDVSGHRGRIVQPGRGIRDHRQRLSRCSRAAHAGVEFQKIPTPLWKFYLADVVSGWSSGRSATQTAGIPATVTGNPGPARL